MNQQNQLWFLLKEPYHLQSENRSLCIALSWKNRVGGGLEHSAKPAKPSTERLFQAIKRSTKPIYEVRSTTTDTESWWWTWPLLIGTKVGCGDRDWCGCNWNSYELWKEKLWLAIIIGFARNQRERSETESWRRGNSISESRHYDLRAMRDKWLLKNHQNDGKHLGMWQRALRWLVLKVGGWSGAWAGIRQQKNDRRAPRKILQRWVALDKGPIGYSTAEKCIKQWLDRWYSQEEKCRRLMKKH